MHTKYKVDLNSVLGCQMEDFDDSVVCHNFAEAKEYSVDAFEMVIDRLTYLCEQIRAAGPFEELDLGWWEPLFEKIDYQPVEENRSQKPSPTRDTDFAVVLSAAARQVRLYAHEDEQQGEDTFTGLYVKLADLLDALSTWHRVSFVLTPDYDYFFSDLTEAWEKVDISHLLGLAKQVPQELLAEIEVAVAARDAEEAHMASLPAEERDQTLGHMQDFVVSLLVAQGIKLEKAAQVYSDQERELLIGFKAVILDKIRAQVKEEQKHE